MKSQGPPRVVNAGLTFPARNIRFGAFAPGRRRPRDEGGKMARSLASPDFVRRLEGFSLTTAEILYRLPDHPGLLQTYVWQDYDLAPKFPALMKFLAFWRERLDGPLHSVRVAHARLIRPAELRNVDAEMLLH
jgi:uncharacterized protein Usg